MNKNIFLILTIIIFIIFCIAVVLFWRKNKETKLSDAKDEFNLNTNLKIEDSEKDISNLNNNTENSNNAMENFYMDTIIIKVNGKELNVKLENNTSARAFAEKLKDEDIVVNANDYGNFEKVGNLGFSLPTNDKNLTTESGDLILYQGNQITLYYDTNTWNFTKLGKVQNVSQNELKNILGKGNVVLTFSLGK